MMKMIPILAGAAFFVFATTMTTKADLAAGDDAPDFSLQGSDGKMYRVSEFKGKQAMVVAWYPKAFTGG